LALLFDHMLIFDYSDYFVKMNIPYFSKLWPDRPVPYLDRDQKRDRD